MKKFNFLISFFYSCPVFFYSIFFLLGIAFFLYNKFILLFFFVFSCNKKKLLFSIMFFLIAFFYSSYFFSDIKKIDKPIEGISLFKIDSIKEIYNFNNKYYLYKGTIKTFQNNNSIIYHNIQASISAKKFYSPCFLYNIDGTIIPNENYNFYIKTKKSWEKFSTHFSFTKLRFNLKKVFYKYLKKTIKDKNSTNFLYALITGNNSNKFLSFSFSKIGLQHVLAISGLHFGIFILFFAFLLRLFLPRILVTYLLLILVNVYFLFIGPLISVQRAYLMIQMALFSQIINRKYFALNSLAISLIVILLINPLNLKTVGFQLSFLCTFAILLIYPIIDPLSLKIFKKRTLSEINKLNMLSKIGLKLINYLRQSLCLCISINILILPVILYYFHKFALLSIIYNLFIPFLIGISLILVIIGLIFYFIIPPLSLLINSLNIILTKIILKLITYPPVCLQFYLRYKNLSSDFLIVYLTFMILLFLMLRYHLKKEQFPEYCYFL